MTSLKTNSRQRLILFTILLGLQVSILYGQKFSISGTIEDKQSGERLIGANIYDSLTYRGVSSNNFGFYSLTLPGGLIRLIYSYVGYQPRVINLDLKKDTVINISLESFTNISEVIIRADAAKSAVRSNQISMTELSGASINKIPVLLGEVDVLKALQLLPGVQSGTEGTSGIYVRGGGPDQNLILLDGVPVYNVNHLFGFFSVFNSDAIQTVKLIKGGFPARYGGRLSSVLDIRLKDGNNKKFEVDGSVGIIASRLTVQGPIKEGKTSYIVSARRTYADILAQPLIRYAASKSGQAGSSGGYYFYDLTAKINHRFSDRSRLYLSAYSGKDKAYIHIKEKQNDYRHRENLGLSWGNLTTALRWNYVFSPRLFSNTTLTYSKYNFITSMDMTETEEYTLQNRLAFSYDSGIRDLAAKIDFDYQPAPSHSVKFGYGHIAHQFKPGVSVYQMEEEGMASPLDTTYGNKNIHAQELDAYVEDDWQIGTRFKVNGGLHGSAFHVQDSTYWSFQPRLSALFMISENWSVKAAYSHMSQNIHLVSNSTIGLPTDLWVPSTALIKPQKSIQYALGTVYDFPKGIEVSLEGYFKSMNNLIEYKEGSSFFSINDDWENKLEFGRGISYGGELLIRKKMGKTTGWIGYTLSRTERKFENISFGEWFPYRYDRRHDISIVLNHKFNDKIDIGLTWVYGTGNAVTLPVMMYTREFWPGHSLYPNQIMVYEGRNSYRMPAYHRLDLGINLHKEKKWGIRTWSFGAYNAYSRQNPFFMTQSPVHTQEGDVGILFRQYSIFPIIPSVSYSFKIK